MANYKVAYGKKINMDLAIERGIIPPGCIILTEDTNELFFYDLDHKLTTYESRYKFDSLEEASEWVESYDCKGQIISVHEENACKAYIVGYDNKLNPISSSDEGKSMFEVATPTDLWVITHNLGRAVTATTFDNSMCPVIGEVVHNDSESIHIRFSQKISGFVYLY